MTCVTRTRHSFIVIITAPEDAGGDAEDADEAQDDEGGSKHKQHQPHIFIHPFSPTGMAIGYTALWSGQCKYATGGGSECTDFKN